MLHIVKCTSYENFGAESWMQHTSLALNIPLEMRDEGNSNPWPKIMLASVKRLAMSQDSGLQFFDLTVKSDTVKMGY